MYWNQNYGRSVVDCQKLAIYIMYMVSISQLFLYAVLSYVYASLTF